MALGVRKSIPEELFFAKLAFNKTDFLDLAKFDLLDLANINFLNLVKSDFLDLAEFIMVNKFIILLPILLPLLLLLFDAS